MNSPSRDIPPLVRQTAMSRGAAGRVWLDALPATVAGLARDWRLVLGGAFTGGTESLVVEATTAAGAPAVLKVAMPGDRGIDGEAATLATADGRAYARLFRHDASRRALLLERLGPELDGLGLAVGDQIAIICRTLAAAWMPPPEDGPFVTGAQKAAGLAATIEAGAARFAGACAPQTVAVALRFAGRRAAAFDRRTAVLAHGDAHGWNTLAAPEGGFRLVDPDGIVAEPASDLAISMREWSIELLAGDPVAGGLERCALLARLGGVPLAPIWEWGLAERVANGFLLLDSGMPDLAGPCLAVADAWAAADPP